MTLASRLNNSHTLPKRYRRFPAPGNRESALDTYHYLVRSSLVPGCVVREPNPISDTLNRSRTTTRILTVDDFERYRLAVSSLLHERPDLQVICGVSDGLQAVEKAQELTPDLILMDIGLPGLNGIEAARRILKLVPGSKIIFLTQESSPEVIDEAIRLGACGYVLKIQAGADLLAAVDAVLQGKQFFHDGANGSGR